MNSEQLLTDQFEQSRTHLRSVAYRMLGSTAEAEDAVQEAWFRVSRTHTDAVENMTGWLTTVVSRICLDMLRARRARREDSVDDWQLEPIIKVDDALDPEHQALTADAVGLALLVVLETLSPPERLAFVLHDTFGVSFEEIAPIVDRNVAATRQLASRARRRVRGAADAPSEHTLAEQRRVVDAFLAASREGDFDALVAVLDPDVVLRADRHPDFSPGRYEVAGAPGVAELVLKRGTPFAPLARHTILDGHAGAAVVSDGRLRSLARFTVRDGRVTALDLVIDPDTLSRLRV